MKVKPVPVFETDATILQHGFRKRVIVLLSRSYRFLALQNSQGHFFNSARTTVQIWH